MTPWRIRDFHDDDLDAAVRLWDDPGHGHIDWVYSLSEVPQAVGYLGSRHHRMSRL
jgi:hypothetical protein